MGLSDIIPVLIIFVLTCIIVFSCHFKIRIFYRDPIGNQILRGAFIVSYTPFVWIQRVE